MSEKPYEARYSVGERVQVESYDELAKFKRTWIYHHPLSDEQIGYAGASSAVKEIGYYHAGEPLYTLADAPGIWHEQCLVPVLS
jgi:hypothetical protein